MGYLLSIIVFQTLFTLILLLVTYNNKNVFEKLLTLLLFLMSLHFAVKLCFLLFFSDQPAYYTLPSSFTLLYGPALFLLTRATFKAPSLKMVGLHLTPFLLMSAFYIYMIIELHEFSLKNSLVLPFYNKLGFVDLVSPIIYPIISLYQVNTNKIKVNASQYNLVRGLNLLILALPLVSLLFMSLKPFGLVIEVRFVYVFMLVMVVNIAMYKFKSRVFEHDLAPVEVKEKYNTSTLSDTDLDRYQTQLEQYFSDKKPYLEPELTLQTLSLRCGIPKHHLTQLLNTKFNKNFYQFVNEYRVNEVVKHIPKKQSESLVDIAYQCGFNSKSTFNSYFKKITGLTPSEFKKQELLNI